MSDFEELKLDDYQRGFMDGEEAERRKQRSYRLEQLVFLALNTLVSNNLLNTDDVADYSHYLEFGEWK